MDCRKRIFWSLVLASGLAGCTTTGTTTTPPPPPQTGPRVITGAELQQINPADIKKERDLPPVQPTAKQCVAWGDFAVGEAEGMRGSSVQANDARDRARKAYLQAIRIDPKNLDAYVGLAKLYDSMNDDAHALATLDAALKQYPESGGVYFLRGMIYSRRKDWQPAIDNLTKAAQLEPENRTYVNTLGHVLARAGRVEEALKVYRRVNTEGVAYYNLARMMQHMNQLDQSRQYAQMAVMKEPGLQEAQTFLGQLYNNAPDIQQTSGTSDPADNPQGAPYAAPQQ
jgi:tetratricopeptide (TPR) repeat protein